MTGSLPEDYAERVYAGVLGKIIGVYLGRPVEGWRHHRIDRLLGEITYYVNDRHDVPLKNHRLVVPDDDITGTLTFARAMRDYPIGELDAVRVGRTWLNYLIEDRAVLWWGGRGVSTEHTAYLALSDGVPPPETGSAARNGRVVAEQVGAQIFVEGWAMACPGDPERAAALAAQAASVSHDGEALHAARVVAAMVAQAFVDGDVGRLLDTAQSLIPAGSLIHRVISDVREWHATGEDWRWARDRIDERYGYDRYEGSCHVVPNHALVIHALLYGGGDFGRSVGIVTSCGWDTDSNAGNVGCVAGVAGGLAGIDAGPDWRGPVADRMYLPTADGGEAITDAAREAMTVAGYGYALRGLPAPEVKDGARFHFELPGSLQGFASEPAGALRLENLAGHSAAGTRSLALRAGPGDTVHGLVHGMVHGMALTPVFLTPDTVSVPPYGMVACPTLYAGQVVRARVVAGDHELTCRLVAHVYDGGDERRLIAGPESTLGAGAVAELRWRVPDTAGQPLADVGVAVTPRTGAPATAYLDYLTWDGEPDVTLTRPADGGGMWRHAWAGAVDSWEAHWPEPYRLVQNRGTGLISQGTRQWRDYEVSADITPRLARSAGLAARFQELRRYYAVRLADRRTVQLVRVLDDEVVLDEQPFAWEFYRTYQLRLTVTGERIRAAAGDVELAAADHRLTCGGVGLLITDGHTATQAVRVRPHPTRSARTEPSGTAGRTSR